MTKLICGVAYNSKGKYAIKENGKITKAYDTWYQMIRRCYSPKRQVQQPTYIGCSVDEKWYDYQGFADWYENHEYSNMAYQLDKDLLIPNNKIYSPSNCCFVPSELNSLLTDSGRARGAHPQGVYWNKRSEKYVAKMKIKGKQKHLGLFDCPNEAHQVYKKTKEAYVKVKAIEWQDRIADNVFTALMSWQLTD